jgi:glycosyltransferase involved in cell wall biosynthesis
MRFKHCCGLLAAAANSTANPPPLSGTGLSALMADAMFAQRSGALSKAERLYRRALATDQANFDALHMLGVVRLMDNDPEDAAKWILAAIPFRPENFDSLWTNLGLSLAAVAAKRDPGIETSCRKEASPHAINIVQPHELLPLPLSEPPLVSVIVPSFNHADYVASALDSVFRQSYRTVEIIVVDDGSDDNSVAQIAKALEHSPFPSELIARKNRGAPASINEGVSHARGKYISILNSDDSFTSERIEFFVRMLERTNACWAFSRVLLMNERSKAIGFGESPYSDSILLNQARLTDFPSLGSALLSFNHSISTGNLFLRGDFIRLLGGFREFRYNHDWDFCLRAVWESEPLYLDRATYRYRLHLGNTIKESSDAATREMDTILRDYFSRARSSNSPPNPKAPAGPNTYDGSFWAMLGSRRAHLMPRDQLLDAAAELGLFPHKVTVTANQVRATGSSEV